VGDENIGEGEAVVVQQVDGLKVKVKKADIPS